MSCRRPEEAGLRGSARAGFHLGRGWQAAGWAQGLKRGALALLLGHGLPLRRADRGKGAPTGNHPELVQQAVQIDIEGGDFQTEEIC